MKLHALAWLWAVLPTIALTVTATDTATATATSATNSLRRTQKDTETKPVDTEPADTEGRPALQTIEIDSSVFLPPEENKGDGDAQGEIFNGTPAKVTDFPNFALLCYSGATTNCGGCGGILISTLHVLTSARCIHAPDGSEINVSGVRIGATESRSDGTFRTVTSKTSHPDYVFDPNHDPPMFDDGIFVLRNDLAILTLDTPVRTITPAPYNRQQLQTTDTFDVPLLAMGFGGYEQTSAQESNFLRKTTMLTRTDIVCKASVAGVADYQNSEHGCAVGTANTNTCSGDEGGPLVTEKGVIMGITSFGAGQCGFNFPTFYTDIWHYASWIDSQIGKAPIPTPAPTTAGGIPHPSPSPAAPTCFLGSFGSLFGWN